MRNPPPVVGLPVRIDTTRTKPMPGYCLVRGIPDVLGQLFAVGRRTPMTWTADVLAVGDGVDAVRVGDVVLVEQMSGHPSQGSDLVDAGGKRLTIVRCGPTRPSPQTDTEFEKRAARVAAIGIMFRSAKRMPPRATEEVHHHERRMTDITQ